MAESNIISYDHIVCKLGSEELDQNRIRELRIEKRINDHIRIYLTGIVSGDQKQRYLEMTAATTQISVECAKAGGTALLFRGLVTNIGVKAERDVYYFEIEGASYTYNLDIKRRDYSFQDSKLKYSDMIENIISEYKAICNKVAVHDEMLETFLLQYRETSWNFLKRVASLKPFNTGLVADASGEKPQFWFGIPEGIERAVNDSTFRYNIKKKIAAYRDASGNYQSDAGEGDFVEYELVTDEFYNIGDTVNFKGQKLRVSRAVAIIDGSVLKFECVLTTTAGLKQNPIYNQPLTGVSVEGKVIAVEKDNLKVSLVGIGEKNQAPEKAYWFPYATTYTAEGNTGWYCMPELEDYVQLYFPTYQEQDAFITTAVRFREQNENGEAASQKLKSDKIDNPRIKYFRTKFGKEIMFSEQEILITGKDDELLVRLNEEKGIEILSPQAVTITAKKDITINSDEGKVIISADKELDLICKSSSIKMDGETHLKGTQVKVN